MPLRDASRILCPLACALLALSCGDDGGSEPFEALPNVAPTPSAGPANALPSTPGAADPSSELGPMPRSLTGNELPSAGLPCGVQSILQQNCVKCHAATPQYGAPMPLVSYADLLAPAVSQPSRKVYDLVLERIASDTRPMPPVPNDRLSVDDRAALGAWVQGGTPKQDELCRAIEQAAPPATFLGVFPPEERCDVPIELHANGGAEQPFEVPQEDDHYECFYFRTPQERVQLLGIAPLIDDSRVVHHWLLYTNEDGGLEDGTRETCNGIHPTATLLAGWAPGGPSYGFPEGVGIEIPSGDDARFILEIHYNNVARRTDARDRSGARLCGTRTPQPNVAAVHWLGTENIFLLPGQSDAGSTCKPDLDQPVHLLSITPHMHQLGVHSRVVLNRADGNKEMLIDKPFDFNTQIAYETQTTLQPGDSLTATCSWNNDRGGLTRFGESTQDEMCYFFTLAYPAGSLDTGGNFLLPGVVGGVNKCMH
jgi:mono/diheme cytochrome c family protein